MYERNQYIRFNQIYQNYFANKDRR